MAGGDHGAGRDFRVDDGAGIQHHRHGADWYTVWTPLSFFLTLFIGGPLLGYLLLRVAGVDGWALRLLPVVSLLALLVSIMVVVMQEVNLPPSAAQFSRPPPWCRITGCLWPGA